MKQLEWGDTLCGKVITPGRGKWQRPSLIRRFLSKFQMTDGCWQWQGSGQCKTGYGNLREYEGGKQVKSHLAHRLSFEFFNGPIPDDHCVCHRCDNPRCVNPAHLFAGTIKENNQDMFRKGRNGNTGLPGETNHQAKLTRDDVSELRKLRDGGMSYPKLAKRFGIALSHAQRIVNRENWK